ncbi:MAG TPA: class I SAM-dependent rRNA methyltransferase, partial [Acidobacteriota bacterium]|nr:class I SAM-dependent rRNA methyltransferase [Acidobacteriota bacterium]
MSDKKVILHRGKEKAIRNHHHWIFSGAIKHLPEFENGDVLPVFSSEKEFLGWGYFHSKCSITGRMISFEQKDPRLTLKEKIQKAIEFRRLLFENSETNACRIINSEGDGIPGLIVDKYNEILVIQISTLGIEKLKPVIVETLTELLSPASIFEHSASPSRREEGLKTVKQLLAGNPVPQLVEIRETGLTFFADIERGQKTGFFLDQREMRRLVGELAINRRVLNCFSYTGAFSVYALKGGARQVDSVDISAEAIEATRRHFEVNHCELEGNRLIVEDVFSFLRQPELPYD